MTLNGPARTKFHATVAEAAAMKLRPGERSARPIAHGSMSVRYYAPTGEDAQSPHGQDEVYVVVRGGGWFRVAGERVRFGAGDVLFVPAGVAHRFEDFTGDFATWVVFYGPDGGEGGGLDAEQD